MATPVLGNLIYVVLFPYTPALEVNVHLIQRLSFLCLTNRNSLVRLSARVLGDSPSTVQV